MNQIYLDSARLLTRVAPLVLVDDTFALKGGTATVLIAKWQGTINGRDVQGADFR